jgi:hypothetical protein
MKKTKIPFKDEKKHGKIKTYPFTIKTNYNEQCHEVTEGESK